MSSIQTMTTVDQLSKYLRPSASTCLHPMLTSGTLTLDEGEMETIGESPLFSSIDETFWRLRYQWNQGVHQTSRFWARSNHGTNGCETWQSLANPLARLSTALCWLCALHAGKRPCDLPNRIVDMSKQCSLSSSCRNCK